MDLARFAALFAIVLIGFFSAGCQETSDAQDAARAAEPVQAAAQGVKSLFPNPSPPAPLPASGARGDCFGIGTKPDVCQGAPPAQRDAGPVLGQLRTRDKLITIRTGRDGPLYTVKTKDGTVLAINLSADELKARFPELKGMVDSGVAGERIWAGP